MNLVTVLCGVDNRRPGAAHHCKNSLATLPSPADRRESGCHLPNPARESLVSDIPAGEGNVANLFFPVQASGV
jgi:hypothetical protein